MMRLWLALALAVLGGCIEWEQTITIRADGSGTQALAVRMTASAQDMVARLAAVDTSNAIDPMSARDPEVVRRELEGTGLEMVAHQPAPEGSRGFDLTLAFDDPSELRKSPLMGSRAQWVFEAGPRPGLVRVVLYPQGKQVWEETRRRIQAMRDDPSALDDDDARRWFARKKTTLEGLDLTLHLVLPGPVVGCTNNLQRDTDNPFAVVAHVTAADIETPEDLLQWLAPRFLVDFDGRGMTFPVDPR